MYVIGFGCAYLLGVQRTKSNPAWNKEEVSDLMTYLMLGVVLGGRIGYVLFYGMGYWAQDLLYPFKIWEGGMSFHGGLLGVMFALWLFGRKKGKRLGCHRLCRADDSARAVLWPHRQFHQRRTVGTADGCALGHGFPRHARRHSAPPLAAL